jgi:hypothetical protein
MLPATAWATPLNPTIFLYLASPMTLTFAASDCMGHTPQSGHFAAPMTLTPATAWATPLNLTICHFLAV